MATSLLSRKGLDSDQLLTALDYYLCGTSIKSFHVVAANHLVSAMESGNYPKAIIFNTDPDTKPGNHLPPNLLYEVIMKSLRF